MSTLPFPLFNPSSGEAPTPGDLPRRGAAKSLVLVNENTGADAMNCWCRCDELLVQMR
jgi:hypothetical protein